MSLKTTKIKWIIQHVIWSVLLLASFSNAGLCPTANSASAYFHNLHILKNLLAIAFFVFYQCIVLRDSNIKHCPHNQYFQVNNLNSIFRFRSCDVFHVYRYQYIVNHHRLYNGSHPETAASCSICICSVKENELCAFLFCFGWK